jgi:TM2 domain-containing membrane protein YozV
VNVTTAAYDPRQHPPELRASDAQREDVATVVRRALDDGRLQLSELDERLGAVYAARTHGELGRVIADLVALPAPRVPAPPPPPAVPVRQGRVSERKILPAALLCFLLGPFGAHRFYAGKTGSGVAMLVLTLSIIGVVVTGIWALVDLIVLIVGAFRDGDGRKLRDWT